MITHFGSAASTLTSWNLFSSLFMILIRRTSFSALSSLKMQLRSSPKPCKVVKNNFVLIWLTDQKNRAPSVTAHLHWSSLQSAPWSVCGRSCAYGRARCAAATVKCEWHRSRASRSRRSPTPDPPPPQCSGGSGHSRWQCWLSPVYKRGCFSQNDI